MRITATVELKVTLEATDKAAAHRLLLGAFCPGERCEAVNEENTEEVRLTVISRHVRIWPKKQGVQ